MNDDGGQTGFRKQRTVVITGGLGNLGTKLCRHLLSLNDNDDATNDDDNHHGEGSAPTKTNFTYKVILVEHPSFITAAASQTNTTAANSTTPLLLLQDANVTLLPCNLGNPTPGQRHRLIKALTHADVVVHFSAVNPYPNATWDDCSQSLDHIYYIFTLAVRCSVRRAIFASSNHVVGGYKDDHQKRHGRRGSLFPHAEPRVGTMPRNADDVATSGDGKAYGAAKLAGERHARTLGNLYGDVTTFVVLRVGWCQPGENIPATLTAAGSPPEFLLEEKNMDGDDDDDDDYVDDDGMKQGATKEDVEQSKKNNNNLNNTTADDDAANKDELWYKQMWLSNRDFLAYFTAAMDVIVPTTAATATSIATSEQSGAVHHQQHNNNVQKGFLLLNAMSRNCNARWNLDDTEKWLGVISIDDSMA